MTEAILLKTATTKEDYSLDITIDYGGLMRGDLISILDTEFVCKYSKGGGRSAGYDYNIVRSEKPEIPITIVEGTLITLLGVRDIREDASSSNYDDKGNASHYTANRIDNFTVYERTFGTENTMTFCEMNALKYRMRLGYKDQPIDQEMKKILWYEKAAKYYRSKIGTEQEIIVDNRQEIDYINNYI